MSDARNNQAAKAALLQAIGALVIHAGYVEWGMGRALLWLRGEPAKISEVSRLGWQQLVDRLAEWGQRSEDGRRVVEVLEAHNIAALTKIRHNIVHGRISIADAPNFSAVRHAKTGSAIIIGGLDDIDDAQREFRRLAMSLESLMPESYRRLRG